MNDNEILLRLQTITSMFSPYAPIPESDFSKLSVEMIQEIESFEKNIKSWTHLHHYHIAIAYRNYNTWYVRGENRKQFLEKMLLHLENSCMMDNNFIESKVELAHVLIEEKIIRNIDKALILIAELIQKDALPSWMNSFVEKAKRWSGNIELPTNNDFSKLDPTPGVLREERTKLRKLLTDSMKNNDNSSDIIASRLYNLGLLVAYLYDSHDCNSGVMGMVYDKAEKKHKKIAKKFNFEYLGRIENAEYLTDTDYKRIEKIFGVKEQIITIDKIKSMI